MGNGIIYNWLTLIDKSQCIVHANWIRIDWFRLHLIFVYGSLQQRKSGPRYKHGTSLITDFTTHLYYYSYHQGEQSWTDSPGSAALTNQLMR